MTSKRCKVAYNYVSFSIKYPVMWGFVVWIWVGGKLEQRMQQFSASFLNLILGSWRVKVLKPERILHLIADGLINIIRGYCKCFCKQLFLILAEPLRYQLSLIRHLRLKKKLEYK